MSLIAVYITHANETEARKLVDAVVGRRLAACGNLLPIESAYWWQGQVQHEEECVSILKSTAERWDELREAVEQLHPYDVPCIVRFDIQANAAYEQWVRDQVAAAKD